MLYMTDEVIVEGRILEWGNSYGIRVRKADLERAGLAPGEEAIVRIARRSDKVDLSHVRFLRGDRSDVSERHDEYLGEARLADLKRKQRARR